MHRAFSSVRGTLLVWLIGAVLVSGMAAAVVVYTVALHEISELFDYHIRQLALSLGAQSLPDGGAVVALPDASGHEENDFAVQIWNNAGESLYLSPNYPALPPRAQLGFSDIRDATGEWRVYAVQSGSRTIQVVQPMDVRREMAFAGALRTLVPLLLVIPLLVAAVWITVGRALRPLQRVVQAVERRGATDLEPLAEAGLPMEIAPVVAALNRLLRRLEESIAAQRAFVGDAAHELRTPLTALRLQGQVLVRTAEEHERRAAGEEFIASVDRATRLVEQLLELARSESDATVHAFGPVRLDELVREVVAQFAATAVEKGIDLGADACNEVIARGDAQSLRILLRNLVDNAVRYAPGGGRVDVSATLRDGRPTIGVADTGPGIPHSERERVFARFYRLPGNAGSGSGLGLAIVRRIADMHAARVTLESGEGGVGLKTSVVFPPESIAPRAFRAHDLRSV